MLYQQRSTATRRVGAVVNGTAAAAVAILLVSGLTLVIPYLQGWGGHPYSRPDMDLISSYQGLLLSDGAYQRDVSHHGYAYYLLLSAWYRLAHLVGAIPIGGFADWTASADKIATYGQAVVAGRAFSLVLGVVLSTAFLVSAWLLTRSRPAALIAGVLFALGEGNAFQTIGMRTELPASLFLLGAFLSLVKAARSLGWQAHGWLATAGFFSSLAYNSKLHALFALLALPVLAIAFGQVRDHRPSVTRALTTRQVALVLIALLLPVAPAWVMLLSSIGKMSGRLSFVYVPATIVLCACCVWWYGGIFHVSRRERVLAAAAVVFGFGAGLSLLFVKSHPLMFPIDANPLEHMSRYVLQGDVRTTPDALGRSSGGMLLAALKHTWLLWFGGSPLATAYQLLLWTTGAGAIWLAFAGRWQPAARIALLIGLASLLYGISSIRYGDFSPVYWVFLDLWMFLALAILVAELIDLCGRPWRSTVVAAVAAMGAFVIAKNIAAGTVDWTQPPSNICEQVDGVFPDAYAAVFHPLCK